MLFVFGDGAGRYLQYCTPPTATRHSLAHTSRVHSCPSDATIRVEHRKTIVTSKPRLHCEKCAQANFVQ